MAQPEAPLWTVALRIAYDGSRFAAYARNPAGGTVEDALLAALRQEGLVEGSFKTGSRTDAGVSALENVCRAQLRRKTLRGLVPALQKLVPDGLWVTGAAEVGPGFNPRHARRRRYRYVAALRGEDLARVAAACQAFVGRHDMRGFARMEEGRDPVRNVFAFQVEPLTPASGAPLDGAGRPRLARFAVEGDGFLWNQVRRMVSAALAVGRGEAEVADIEATLETGKPHKRFRVAAVEGLLLERVEYDNVRWSQEAGALGRQLTGRPLQCAAVAGVVAAHLASLAPWDEGAGPSGDEQRAGPADDQP